MYHLCQINFVVSNQKPANICELVMVLNTSKEPLYRSNRQ